MGVNFSGREGGLVEIPGGSEKKSQSPDFGSPEVGISAINIMGDELLYQSWIFDMFILDRIDQELNSLKCLDLKFGL